MTWEGVPAPLRWWLHAQGRLSSPEALAGCGCLRWLKHVAPLMLAVWLRKLARKH